MSNSFYWKLNIFVVETHGDKKNAQIERAKQVVGLHNPERNNNVIAISRITNKAQWWWTEQKKLVWRDKKKH